MCGILPIPEIFICNAGRGAGCLHTTVPTNTDASCGVKTSPISDEFPA